MDYTFLNNHVYAVTHTQKHTHSWICYQYISSEFPARTLFLDKLAPACNAQEVQQHIKVHIFSFYIWFFSCHAFLSGCSGL